MHRWPLVLLAALAACACETSPAPAAATRTHAERTGERPAVQGADKADAQAPTRLPPGALAVPLVYQSNDHTCGAAALASVLYYWSAFDGKEEDLYGHVDALTGARVSVPARKDLRTSSSGTTPRRLEAVARAYGLDATFRRSLGVADLRAALARGATVILDLQAWADTSDYANEWESGHYVVLVGLDERFVYVMDPLGSGGYAWLPVAELAPRWHDDDGTPYHGGAIVISGRSHLGAYPALPAWRMDGKDATPPAPPADLLPVPLVRQSTGYTCGAASLLSVMLYFRTGYAGYELDVAKASGTTAEGAEPDGLVRAAAAAGLRARLARELSLDDLRSALRAGQVPILALQAWQDEPRPWADDWDDGHYAVLVGLDDAARVAWFMDPSAERSHTYLPYDELATRWHDTVGTERVQRFAVIVESPHPQRHLRTLPAPLERLR